MRPARLVGEMTRAERSARGDGHPPDGWYWYGEVGAGYCSPLEIRTEDGRRVVSDTRDLADTSRKRWLAPCR